MTTLNSRLQLAMLNRKKGRNLIEKGFTLVELMIVIVIVGVLSSVALPNFLGQTLKAKATECNTKGGALLSEIGAEHLSDADAAGDLFDSKVVSDTTNAEFCTFTVDTAKSTGSVYVLDIAGKGDLDTKYVAEACVDADTGKRDLVYEAGEGATLGTKAASCA